MKKTYGIGKRRQRVAFLLVMGACLLGRVGGAQAAEFFQPEISLEYATGGTMPYWVATGDFNDDGHTDAAVANYSTSKTITILPGNGDGTLGAPTSTNTVGPGYNPQVIIAADLKGDGTTNDLVSANFDNDNIAVLLYSGGGAFQAASNYPSSNGPIAMAAARLNSDSSLDLAVATRYDKGVNIFTNKGNGTFAQSGFLTTPYFLSCLIAADLNGDGTNDLATTSDPGKIMEIYLGNGDGTFTFKTNYPTGTSPNAQPIWLAAGDLNGDGTNDLVVGNTVEYSVAFFRGNGDGTFAARVITTIGPYRPEWVGLGDFNGDGSNDVAVTCDKANEIAVCLNQGGGALASPVFYYTGPTGYGAALADFDHDNILDIIAANYDNGTVSLLTGYGNGTFRSRRDYLLPSSGRDIAAGDFNNDGVTDLVTANYITQDISVFMNEGQGYFSTNRADYSAGNYCGAVITRDFNRDGKTDVASLSYQATANQLYIRLGYGNGTFSNQLSYTVHGSAQDLIAADFNNNTNDDIATVSATSNTVSVLLGNGDGSFTSSVAYATGNGPYGIAAADFNLDGTNDLVTANYDATNISILIGNGAGAFSVFTNYSTGAGAVARPMKVAVGDFNLDGRPDIVAALYGGAGNGTKVGVFLGYGDGTFSERQDLTVGTAPIRVRAADINYDGYPDILTANYGSDNVSLLLGNGNGTFQTATNFLAEGGTYSLAVGSFHRHATHHPSVATVNYDSWKVYILLAPLPSGTIFCIY